MKLTKKMMDFCTEYVKCRNATESARKAGYSNSYAESKAYMLLEREEIQKRIANIEETYLNNAFKKLSILAVKKLKDILEDSENRPTQFRAVKLSLQVAGIIDRHGDIEQEETDTVFKLIIPEEYEYLRNE